MNVASGLTDRQRQQWDERGFLLVERGLEPSEVATVLRAVDGVIAAHADSEYVFSQRPAAGAAAVAYKVAQAISLTDALDPLIDHGRSFPLLLDLLGPYLQVLGTEIFVRPPGESGELLVDWHVDGGPAMGRFLPDGTSPVLQLKAQYFLTDVSEPDAGNFLCVPGSHRRPFPGGGDAAWFSGAEQVLARAGDLLLFPRSLWHAVAPNRSGRTRTSVTIRFGQLWSRPYDYEKLPDAVLSRMTPRRRRLFGDLGRAHPSSYYYVDEEEQLRILQKEA